MLRTYFVLTFIILLGACSLPDGRDARTAPFEPRNGHAPTLRNGTLMPVDNQRMQTQPLQPTIQGANGKVAILLPLSGPQSAIGKSMLNAAQMALFDVNDAGFELLPFDTKSTPRGTTDAVTMAAQQGVKLILGPLLANNVAAAGMAARRANLQVIGFTTDSSKVTGNVSTLGILPYDQGSRMANYASRSSLNRIAIIDPNNAYSNAVIKAFEATARNNGLQITDKISYKSPASAPQIASQLSTKQGTFDAIFMPVGNPNLASLARALSDNGLSTNLVPWLGAGLWDDRTLQGNPVMRGAIYAAPTQQQRMSFEKKYQSTYGTKPQRLASLAYDATALSIVLLRKNNADIDRQSIMNPNGFAGVDGIFRIQSNGLAERGLAIHRIVGAGRTTIIDQAPNSFQVSRTSF